MEFRLSQYTTPEHFLLFLQAQKRRFEARLTRPATGTLSGNGWFLYSGGRDTRFIECLTPHATHWTNYSLQLPRSATHELALQDTMNKALVTTGFYIYVGLWGDTYKFKLEEMKADTMSDADIDMLSL